MPRKKNSVNRSAFVRDQLQKNPAATAADVREAWKAQGHKTAMSATLYYQVRARFNSGKGRRPGRPKSKKPSASGNGYLEIESVLDRLILEAVGLPDEPLATELRVARRHVSARLV